MIRALGTAAAGLSAQERNVDMIANNLANVNTNGFKRMRVDFQDLFYARIKEPGSRSATAGAFIPTGIQVGHGVQTAATTTIFREGPPIPTDRPLDVMIMNSRFSFFEVELPNGEMAYTRDGSFHKDAAGDMVTSQGHRLTAGINLPDDSIGTSIGADGTVQAIFRDQPSQVIGQLELFSFPNPTGLRAIGGNLFMETNSSGAVTSGTPGEEQFGDLEGGFLEGSNVNAAEELINLIKAQRAFEMNSRTITAADEMLQTTAALRR